MLDIFTHFQKYCIFEIFRDFLNSSVAHAKIVKCKDSSATSHIRARFSCDLFHKFKIIFGKFHFSDQFKKTIKHYKNVGYNMDII